MFRVPLRCVVVPLAATAYKTAPLPLPLAPDVIVNQAALLVAVQAQPAADVTVTVPFDAAPPTDTLAGEMDQLHGAEKANVLD